MKKIRKAIPRTRNIIIDPVYETKSISFVINDRYKKIVGLGVIWTILFFSIVPANGDISPETIILEA